jgi:hypothetical protein
MYLDVLVEVLMILNGRIANWLCRMVVFDKFGNEIKSLQKKVYIENAHSCSHLTSVNASIIFQPQAS